MDEGKGGLLQGWVECFALYKFDFHQVRIYAFITSVDIQGHRQEELVVENNKVEEETADCYERYAKKGNSIPGILPSIIYCKHC